MIPAPRPALWLRIALLLTIALALASTIAAGTTDAPYEDRLVDAALRQTYAPQWKSVATQPIAVKALLLDYDHELAFKAQLGLEKYGDDAQEVLLRFGDDPTFQQVLRQYGENTIPVIAYFVHNDISSLRLTYLAQQKSDSAIAAAKSLWDRFWSSQPAQTPDNSDSANANANATEIASYGPDLRGQRAIGFIVQEGHQFLGQFVLNAEGKAAWVQTERSLGAAKSFFFSGVIGLEKKYQSGQPIDAVDVLGAGLDVFIVTGTFKALKFLRASQQVRTVGVLKRSQLLAAPLLGRSALGRYAMKYGVVAGTAYLVMQHPSLLNGIFVTVGQWLGVSPLLAKTVGWSALLLPLLWPLLSLLGWALSASGSLLLATGKSLRWSLHRLGFSRAAAPGARHS
jgi:hypothetical protein